MRSVFLGFTLALGALTAACTIDPPAGTPTPPMAGVLSGVIVRGGRRRSGS